MKRRMIYKGLLTAVVVLLGCGAFAQQTAYHIGDLYTAPDGSLGIVYFVRPDGGGWVVALNDASTSCTWGDETDVPGLINYYNTEYQQRTSDDDGYTNTQILRAYQSGNGYAASIVDFANGWELPSPAQLSMLYAQLPFISSALVNAGGSVPAEQNYWTSAEESATHAWYVAFNNGSISSYNKTSLYRVRAVRCFTNPSYTYLWSNGSTRSEISVIPTQTEHYSVTVTAGGAAFAVAEQQIVLACQDTTHLEASACGYYVWLGDTLTHTGDYVHVFQNSAGLDSVVILRLHISEEITVGIQTQTHTVFAGDAATLSATVSQPSENRVFPGDILCTDGTVVSASNWPVPGKTAQGVVFYVDYSGLHGWAVHLYLQAMNSTAWGLGGIDLPTLPNYTSPRTVITDYDGYENTRKIREAGDASEYPAAWVVNFEQGWYLPAAGQLVVLFSESNRVNASLQIVGGTQIQPNTSLWASTEYGSSTAWSVSNSWGVGNPVKNASDGVRGIRSF